MYVCIGCVKDVFIKKTTFENKNHIKYRIKVYIYLSSNSFAFYRICYCRDTAMGQTHSDNTNLQKPFSLKCHHSTCSLKQAIQQNDYYSFHQELKSRLHSMGLSPRRLQHPSDYVATINSSFEHCDTISGILKENVKLYAFNRRLSSSLMHLDIDDKVDDKSNMIWNGDKLLTCKIGECKKAPGEFTGRVMLYVPCLCPGRYAALDINNLDRTGRYTLYN